MNTNYIKKEKLGEGTYATIHMADEVESLSKKKFLDESEEYVYKRCVALKRIKLTEYSQGIEISAIREIKALKQIKNKHVIDLYDVFLYNKNIHLVLEYIHTDLEAIIQNKQIIIMPADIKAWLLMTLKGLYACHRKFIIHRDIKPNNILINNKGIVKIADFGLARGIDVIPMTNNVVTRWYRAPELLFGSKHYSFSVDMWAIGCVFAELFLRTPFFASDNDFQHVELVFKALGTPTEKEWKNHTTLPNYVKYPIYNKMPFKTIFTAASDDAIELLEKMLVFDPTKRITCLNAIKHDYFKNLPKPTECNKLPYYERNK